METELEQFDYIISIDFGTTFSGSCYSYIKDKKKIVHVVKWPEQSENDTFEKTPTACLYKTDDNSSPKLIKWGKAAYDHVIAHPNDPSLLFIDQFKLKLHDVFKQQELFENDEWDKNIYVIAGIDYLREIHGYTCKQLMQNATESVTPNRLKYVLTVPATWVNRDSSAMRTIAIKAGIIDEINDPPEKLDIISEAHAASLFCEREYCLNARENKSKLYNGQRYLVCDAGGGTIDLATYECTTTENGESFIKNDHCQLALESGGCCGSTILDKNMENYLRDHVFIGCIEETALKSLVEQFVKEIKHYFGGDQVDRNNYLPNADISKLSSTTEQLSLREKESISNVVVTDSSTNMLDIVENDYDYNQDYENQNCEEDEHDEDGVSTGINSDLDMDDEIYNDNDEEMFEPSDSDEDDNTLLIYDHVYFTLPQKSIDSSVLENLSLKGNIIVHTNKVKQLRITQQEIAKHVFDPVVEKVIDLIRKQIKKARTTIDTLFLLGGFGQSPYLYKRLHEEFITSTNSIKHLIVPEDGYRASMRGGIYYGMDSVDTLPQDRFLRGEEFASLPLFYNSYRFLIGIDFNFYDLNARFSIIETDKCLKNCRTFTSGEKLNDAIYQLFTFNIDKFLEEYYDKYLAQYLQKLFTPTRFCSNDENSYAIDAEAEIIDEEFIGAVYYNYIVYAFVEQLFKQIEQFFKLKFLKHTWNPDDMRYTVSFASAPATQQPFSDSQNKMNQDNTLTTGMEKLQAALINKLIESKNGNTIGLDVLVKSNSTILTKQNHSSTKGSSWWSYVFAAAKRVGMVDSNSCAERFLKNNQCIYGSFLASKNYVFRDETYQASVAKMLQIKLPDSIAAKNEMNFYTTSFDLRKNVVNFLSLLHANKKSKSAIAQIFTFDFNTTEEKNIKATKLKLDTKFVDSLQVSESYEHVLNFNKPNSSLSHRSRLKNQIGVQNLLFLTVDSLLIVLSLATDVMTMHLREYLKEKVDLCNAQEEHTIKDMFIDSTTNQIAAIKISPLLNVTTIDMVHQGILTFSETKITTQQILNMLIIPWIRFRLAPAIMDICWEHRIQSDTIRHYVNGDLCIIISGQIIGTKFNSTDSEHNDKMEALYEFLKTEIEFYFRAADIWANVPYCIYYDTDPDSTRHLDSLAHGLAVQQKQHFTRIARRRYAVHFIEYKNNDNLYKYTKENYSEKCIDEQENGLVLHPLIEINQNLPLRKPYYGSEGHAYEVPFKHNAKSRCYLSAVIYGSEDKSEQEYFISNNSFKKLHRFIIPINNLEEPFTISYTIEKYSILFTVKQDDFEADFRCNDYLFRVKEEVCTFE